MAKDKIVKDVMIDVFEYPHIPYWFTIRQAIGIIKKSLIGTEKCIHPQAVLIFDEKYNLMGLLTLRDILMGLEPSFLRPEVKAQVMAESREALSLIWASLFNKESKKQGERPVSEVMVPVKVFVEPDDPIAKAAYLMVHNDLLLIPVLERKQKLVGLVRMLEIFEEVSKVVLEEEE